MTTSFHHCELAIFKSLCIEKVIRKYKNTNAWVTFSLESLFLEGMSQKAILGGDSPDCVRVRMGFRIVA